MLSVLESVKDVFRRREAAERADTRELIERLAVDDSTLTTSGVAAEIERLGIDPDALDDHVFSEIARRDLQKLADELPARKEALETAGVRKQEMISRHFNERRAIDDRHRAERFAMLGDYSTAQAAVEEAEQAVRDLDCLSHETGVQK